MKSDRTLRSQAIAATFASISYDDLMDLALNNARKAMALPLNSKLRASITAQANDATNAAIRLRRATQT